MMKNRILSTAKVVGVAGLFGISAVAGCSVTQLQAGLESPPPQLITRINSATLIEDFPTEISNYESFLVRVTPDISVNVYAREFDEAEANIFLVHGAGGGAWSWEYYFELLPRKFNVYALSWRGHFDSSPVEDARIRDYVRDQEAALLSVSRRNDLPIHVVGHSYGGASATIQAAQSELDIKSLTLLAPVVPLDYTLAQRLIVPTIAPYFIKTGEPEQIDGTFGDMFLSETRRRYYFDAYASQDYSIEKPGLIAGDGVSARWQSTLDEAFEVVTSKAIPTEIVSARFDNVIVPRRQERIAKLHNIEMITIESGHYIPLDDLAEESVELVITHIESASD